MTAEQTDPKALARVKYARGQDAFERGSYRESVDYFEQAVALARAATPLGGEIQTWLVNAYSAVDRQADAIALCEKLARHPDPEIRKQGKNLLYILKAPQLKRPDNWMTRIPDLQGLEGNENRNFTYATRPKSSASGKFQPEIPPLDPSQINTKDNGFLWVALIGVALVLGGLWWLS